MQSYIFGGNTGLSYDEVQRQRDVANELLRANMNTPRDVGEGLSAIGRALAAKAIEKRTTRADSANRAAYQQTRDGIFASLNGGMGGGQSASPYSPSPQPSNPNAPQAIADDAMAAIGKPPAWLKYSNTGAIRNAPLHPKLVDALGFAGEMGLTVDVISGGQEPAGKPGARRTGSNRHDHGMSADVDFYKDGRKLDWNNPNDLPLLQEVVQKAKARGITGIGAGDDYMGAGRFHLGFGNPAVWGAGGRGANAPEWLVQAYNGAPATQAQPAQAQPAQGQPQVNPAILMQLAEIQGNPYASESDKAIAGMLMQQVTQSMDPMRNLQMQKLQKEVELMGQPRAQDLPAGYRELDMRAKAAGLQEGSPEYQQFMLSGGGGIREGRPAAFEALHLQALAAGFEEGTPEYQDFMLTRGAGDVAMAREIGKQTGEAKMSLGGALTKGQQALDLIDQIANDPALEGITGMVQGRIMPMTQAGTDLNVKIDQMRGRVFLEAFESLKGAGQITEIEGTKAEAALARLDRAQSTEAYRAALAELADVVRVGMDRAKKRAGAGDQNPEAGSFEEFSADPSAQAAAEKFGVTLQEMWEIKQGLK